MFEKMSASFFSLVLIFHLSQTINMHARNIHARGKKNHHENHLPELRKFSMSKFFHGLANTCAQVGNAMGAQTQQEKQQAALGVVGSLFALAGDITEKEDGVKQQTPHQKTRMIELTTNLVEWMHLDLADQKPESEQFNAPLIKKIARLKTYQERKKTLEKQIAEECAEPTRSKGMKGFFKEVFYTVKQIALVYIPKYVNKFGGQLLNSLDNYGLEHRSNISLQEAILSDFFTDQMLELTNYVDTQVHKNNFFLTPK